jgi:hypothetical protein
MGVSVGGIASRALGQSTVTYTVNSADSAQIEPTGAYYSTTGTGYSEDYLDLSGPNATYPTFAVFDYNTGGSTIPNSAVTSVNPNLTVDLADEYYSGQDTANSTFSFYLATDTTASEVASGSTSLEYQSIAGTPKTAGGSLGNGLAAPGQTGNSLSGSLYYLGSGTFTPSLTDGTYVPFSLSTSNAGSPTLVAAAQAFLTSQVESGNVLRIIVTTAGGSSTDTLPESIYGYKGAAPPQVNITATSAGVSPNHSLLSLVSGNANVNFGRIVEGAVVTETLTLGNTNVASNGSALVLTNPTPGNGLDASTGPTGSNNPIPKGETATVTAGFNGGDTSASAGTAISGSVVFTNANNSSDPGVTVNGSAYVVEQRKISAGGTSFAPSPNAINVGKVLVGTTGTVGGIALNTTNSDLPADSDFGSDVLTTETLQANAQTAPYTIKDPFTTNPVATVSASAPSTPFTFNSATPATGITGSVAVTVSGVYGDDHAVTINGTTKYYEANYTSFGAPVASAPGLVGEGIPGENDYANVYLQWQGYQPASVSSALVTVTPNSTANATLTNAATSDNVYTTGGIKYNGGIRAGAVITGTGPFNQLWSSGGWSLQSGSFSTGTAISGNQGTELAGGGTTTLGTATGTIGFTTNSQMINGTYGATMTVGLENEQDIQGAAPNDLGNLTINAQSTVTSNPSVQSGSYVLNGGTLSATSSTDLTGSFTQTGGQATFNGITGSGSLVLNGGTTTLATGSGGSTVNSLTISGGVLDLTNNHMYIDYGSGSDPITTIAAYIKSGYNNLPGIISSAALTNASGLLYGVGYADGKDGVVVGLPSGQIELKYTLLGDANLDGLVNGSDFNILAANFNQDITGWDQGDFNYDGLVNASDFNVLAANFNQGVSGADASAGDIAALDAFAVANGLSLPTSSVPEPASGVMAIFGVGILARRARRRDNR